MAINFFHEDTAREYGLEKAIIIQTLDNSICLDSIEEKNNFNGFNWTKIDNNFFKKLNYIQSKKIKKYLIELEKLGIIKKTYFEGNQWITIPYKFKNKIKEDSKKDVTRNGWIYLYKQGKYYKIGRSLSEDCRIKKYIIENPLPVELVFKKEVQDYVYTEKFLHDKFKEKRISNKQEWFLLDKKDIRLLEQSI